MYIAAGWILADRLDVGQPMVGIKAGVTQWRSLNLLTDFWNCLRISSIPTKLNKIVYYYPKSVYALFHYKCLIPCKSYNVYISNQKESHAFFVLQTKGNN